MTRPASAPTTPAGPVADGGVPRRRVPVSAVATSRTFTIPATEWDRARGAYLADRCAGGPAATFSEWVWFAVQGFTLRTAVERLAWLAALDLHQGVISQSVPFDTEALELVADAMALDARAGWVGNRSHWLRGALTAATARTQESLDLDIPRARGRLPTDHRLDRNRPPLNAPTSRGASSSPPAW